MTILEYMTHFMFETFSVPNMYVAIQAGFPVWHHRVPKDRREHHQGVDCVATIHDEFKVVDPPVRRFSGVELEDLFCRSSVTFRICGP